MQCNAIQYNTTQHVVKVFLSIKFFSFAKIFIFLPAFSLIVVMWSFQDRFVLNSTPRCLCLSTVSSIVLLNERGNSMLARLLLRVTVSALLLAALNLLPWYLHTCSPRSVLLSWYLPVSSWFLSPSSGQSGGLLLPRHIGPGWAHGSGAAMCQSQDEMR